MVQEVRLVAEEASLAIQRQRRPLSLSRGRRLRKGGARKLECNARRRLADGAAQRPAISRLPDHRLRLRRRRRSRCCPRMQRKRRRRRQRPPGGWTGGFPGRPGRGCVAGPALGRRRGARARMAEAEEEAAAAMRTWVPKAAKLSEANSEAGPGAELVPRAERMRQVQQLRRPIESGGRAFLSTAARAGQPCPSKMPPRPALAPQPPLLPQPPLAASIWT